MTSSRSVAGAQYMNKKQSRLIFFIKKLRFSKFVLGLLNLSVRTYVRTWVWWWMWWRWWWWHDDDAECFKCYAARLVLRHWLTTISEGGARDRIHWYWKDFVFGCFRHWFLHSSKMFPHHPSAITWVACVSTKWRAVPTWSNLHHTSQSRTRESRLD
jgi:hypothetical protein